MPVLALIHNNNDKPITGNFIMSKPIKKIIITTVDEKSAEINAVFDSGSYWTIIREDKIPAGAAILKKTNPESFRTAAPGGKVEISGYIELIMQIGDKMIQDSAHISPNLFSDMLLG